MTADHSGSNSENSHQRKKIPIFFFQREKLHLFPFLFFSSFRKIPISFSFQVFSPFWVFHQNFLPGFFTIWVFPSKVSSKFFHHFQFPIKIPFHGFSTFWRFPFEIPNNCFFHLPSFSKMEKTQMEKKSEFDPLCR